MSFKRVLSIAQTALLSKKVSKKIVVFESDDWGSIRTPPGKVEKQFLDDGLDLLKNPYHKYDVLESSEDVSSLLETCNEIERAVGKKVKVTLNYVTGNPDFEKIKASGFQEYHYELFTKTYERYYRPQSALDLVFKGIEDGYFLPQFHGREHVHAPYWLEQLRGGDEIFLKAFNLGFWGISHDVYDKPKRKVQASFNIRNESDKAFAKIAVQQGLRDFEQIFCFKAQSFIPNNYTWPSQLNETLAQAGIRYMQGMKKLAHPKLEGDTKRKSSLRRAGFKTEGGLISLVRNNGFEPSFYRDKNKELQKCLSEIKTAFAFKQPAVISTHRINFVGGLDEGNREVNLRLFKDLVTSIVRAWPDVEFMSSVELGGYYEGLGED